MTTPRLTARALGRATLARQHLLRRTDADAVEAVRHLVGLQTQVPPNQYTALYSRLAGFDPQEFSRRFEHREFVRLSLMRCTLHTVTADDALALRPLFDVPHERMLRSHFRRELAGADPAAVAARAREVLEEGPPREARGLGAVLAEAWPEAKPRALAMAARQLLPLVQVPPRGLWQRGGAARLTTAEHWLDAGAAGAPPASPENLIRRYLAAFGPASVKDAQRWSGLTRLRPVMDGLRDELVVFRDDTTGAELFDLRGHPGRERTSKRPRASCRSSTTSSSATTTAHASSPIPCGTRWHGKATSPVRSFCPTASSRAPGRSSTARPVRRSCRSGRSPN